MFPFRIFGLVYKTLSQDLIQSTQLVFFLQIIHCIAFTNLFYLSKDWHQEKLPEADAEGYFQTSLPIILFQMLDQNVSFYRKLYKSVILL